MKKTLFFLLFSITLNSCKKGSVTAEEVPKSKTLMTSYIMQETYNGKNTRGQELTFNYDSKGKIENIAQVYSYFDFNSGNVSSKTENALFFTYNNEGLLAEVKTINKLSNGNDVTILERLIYDVEKVIEIRYFNIQNGKEVPYSLSNFGFKYNGQGLLSSYSIGGEEVFKYSYTNNVHSSSAFNITGVYQFEYLPILHPTADYSNGQKIFISRLIDDSSPFGFGLANSFLPKKVSNINSIWESEASTNDKKFPIKITKKAAISNALQNVSITYKTF